MLPDSPSAPIWSGCAIRIITTPGAKCFTKPFMCTMPTHPEADRAVVVVAVVDHPVDLPPFRRRNILWIPIRGKATEPLSQAQDGAFDSEVESILPKDLNVTGLAVGPHLVGVRYQDNNNTWGEVLYQTIHVYDANPSGGQCQWWWGNGVGMGGFGRDCGSGIFYR